MHFSNIGDKNPKSLFPIIGPLMTLMRNQAGPRPSPHDDKSGGIWKFMIGLADSENMHVQVLRFYFIYFYILFIVLFGKIL